jgi:hypothetical protein
MLDEIRIQSFNITITFGGLHMSKLIRIFILTCLIKNRKRYITYDTYVKTGICVICQKPVYVLYVKNRYMYVT